jgi:hypothetical protein
MVADSTKHVNETNYSIWYTEAKPNPSRGKELIPWEKLIPLGGTEGVFHQIYMCVWGLFLTTYIIVICGEKTLILVYTFLLALLQFVRSLVVKN